MKSINKIVLLLVVILMAGCGQSDQQSTPENAENIDNGQLSPKKQPHHGHTH